VSEVDELVRRVLVDVGVAARPPVDVGLVALRWGMEVRRERLDGADGLLRMSGERTVVSVEVSSPRPRARFTLAHELGHYVLAGYPDEVAAVWAAQPSLRDPERFCDRFAESLLLPLDWVRDELTDGPQSLQRLIWTSATAQVSMSAVSVRVARVAGWRRTLLRLARLPRAWGLLTVTGLLRPGWRDAVQITSGTSRRLDDAVGAPGPCEPLWLPLRMEGRPCYVPAQLTASGASAVAWVDLLARQPARRRNPRTNLDGRSVALNTDRHIF
jgi:hypothetical protein